MELKQTTQISLKAFLSRNNKCIITDVSNALQRLITNSLKQINANPAL